MKETRKFYGAYNYMGLDYTWDTYTWEAYVFDSKAEREEWVDNDGLTSLGTPSRQAITRVEAEKIIKCKVDDSRIKEERGD